jgi:hypothetical protein
MDEYKVGDVVILVNSEGQEETGNITKIDESRNDSIHMDFYTVATNGKGNLQASESFSPWKIKSKIAGGGLSKKRRLSKKRKSNKKKTIRRKRR